MTIYTVLNNLAKDYGPASGSSEQHKVLSHGSTTRI